MCDVLTQTGSDKLAYEAAGISADCFYRWLSEIPEFHEQIQAAREEFFNKGKQVVFDRITTAEAYIDRVIQGKEFQVKRFTETTTLANGQQVLKERIEEVQLKPNYWMLERVLGKTADSSTPDYAIEINLAEPEVNEDE